MPQAQAPAFSRLQLAAALLEYDNDPSNPYAPSRRAQDSAIFAHLRRNPAAPPQSSRRSDYLGVSIPSETGSLGGRESALENRRSRASRGSLDALRNPFGPDDHWSDEDECDEEELEVDLASWGLDALIPKDKGKSAKGKAKAAAFTPHPVSSVRSHVPLTNNGSTATAPRRAINTSRSVSLGGIAEHPGLDSKVLEAASRRRRSFGSPLDLVDMEIPQFPLQRPRGSSYSAPRPLSSPIHSVPFPSSSARSPSPFDDEIIDRRVSDGSQPIDRKLSRASMDSNVILQDERTGRTSSEMVEPTSNNPFAIRPPSPSRLSRFDPKAGTTSVSRGSKLLPDQEIIDSQNQPRRERKYSTTLELLRPKVLVMPSPLQQVTQEATPAKNQVRDGFLLSTDGPPLPPGARSARHNSMMSVLDSASKPPVASNSFTPNPLMNLSLSQMTFRNTLHIGGVRDSYSEVVGGIPTALQEGEQVDFDELEVNDEDHALSLGGSGIAGFEDNRPVGKLFGKSLIDDLETRKAQMHSKKRVFAGEQTRSGPFIDLATLNNRQTNLGQNSFGIPDSKRVISRGSSSNAKPLLNFDDEGAKFKSLKPTTRMISSRSVFGVDTLWEREMVKLRKIEAEEQKAAEEQKRQLEQETRGKKKGKKKKKGQDQDQDQDRMSSNFHVESIQTDEHRVSIEPPQLPDIQRATRPPPKVVEDESDDDDPSDDNLEPVVNSAADNAEKWLSDSEDEGPRRTTGTGPRFPNKVRQTSKVEDIDSEEDMPLSAAVNRAVQRQRVTRIQKGDDSDEEKPLSSLLHKTRSTAPVIRPVNFDNLASGEDDDDDKPLALRASSIANYARQDDDDKPLGLRVSSIANFYRRDDDDDKPLGLRASSIANYSPRDDDDDKPLGLRASSIVDHSRLNDDDDRPLGLRASSVANHRNDDDDDRPLALHPEQQRRTQYQMMAQHQHQQQMMVQQQQQMMAQQQQQQMMMQAQLHNSIFFNPSGMLGSGFFGPPVVSPMLMQPPVPAPSPPPPQDAAKFGRVDKWRHDVAVEGTR